MMKKTVALLAVAGLAAATSDFQDDYLALRLTNATRHANSTRVNTTTPIKPVRPIRPHPVRPTMIPKDKLTISTKNLTKEERELLNKLHKRQTEQTRRPVHGVRPRPHTNATNSTKAVGPKKILAQRLDDDEFFVEDDEFFAEDDEFYAEDDEYFVDADDDFFAARLHNRTQTVKPARNSTLGRLGSLLKEAKKDVVKTKDTLKNATIKGKEHFKNATKPAAPKKGFLSMF